MFIHDVDFESVLEGYVLSTKNMYFNQDKFDKNTPGKNVIFVTGLSGSGKSTFCKSLLLKNGGYLFCLDSIRTGRDIYESGTIDYLKAHCNGYIRFLENPEEDLEWDLYRVCIPYVIKYAKTKSDIFLIEGVQIYWGQEYKWYDFRKEPTIVLGTSASKSMSRRVKRTKMIIKEEQLGKSALSMKEISKLVKWYMQDEPAVKYFKRDMKGRE